MAKTILTVNLEGCGHWIQLQGYVEGDRKLIEFRLPSHCPLCDDSPTAIDQIQDARQVDDPESSIEAWWNS